MLSRLTRGSGTTEADVSRIISSRSQAVEAILYEQPAPSTAGGGEGSNGASVEPRQSRARSSSSVNSNSWMNPDVGVFAPMANGRNTPQASPQLAVRQGDATEARWAGSEVGRSSSSDQLERRARQTDTDSDVMSSSDDRFTSNRQDVFASPEVLWESYLYKRGNLNKKWRRRWFVLYRCAVIGYFVSPEDAQEFTRTSDRKAALQLIRGTIRVTQNTEVRQLASPPPADCIRKSQRQEEPVIVGGGFCVPAAYPSKRMFELYSPDAADCRRWVEALLLVIRQEKGAALSQHRQSSGSLLLQRRASDGRLITVSQRVKGQKAGNGTGTGGDGVHTGDRPGVSSSAGSRNVSSLPQGTFGAPMNSAYQARLESGRTPLPFSRSGDQKSQPRVTGGPLGASVFQYANYFAPRDPDDVRQGVTTDGASLQARQQFEVISQGLSLLGASTDSPTKSQAKAGKPTDEKPKTSPRKQFKTIAHNLAALAGIESPVRSGSSRRKKHRSRGRGAPRDATARKALPAAQLYPAPVLSSGEMYGNPGLERNLSAPIERGKGAPVPISLPNNAGAMSNMAGPGGNRDLVVGGTGEYQPQDAVWDMNGVGDSSVGESVWRSIAGSGSAVSGYSVVTARSEASVRSQSTAHSVFGALQSSSQQGTSAGGSSSVISSISHHSQSSVGSNLSGLSRSSGVSSGSGSGWEAPGAGRVMVSGDASQRNHSENIWNADGQGRSVVSENTAHRPFHHSSRRDSELDSLWSRTGTDSSLGSSVPTATTEGAVTGHTEGPGPLSRVLTDWPLLQARPSDRHHAWNAHHPVRNGPGALPYHMPAEHSHEVSQRWEEGFSRAKSAGPVLVSNAGGIAGAINAQQQANGNWDIASQGSSVVSTTSSKRRRRKRGRRRKRKNKNGDELGETNGPQKDSPPDQTADGSPPLVHTASSEAVVESPVSAPSSIVEVAVPQCHCYDWSFSGSSVVFCLESASESKSVLPSCATGVYPVGRRMLSMPSQLQRFAIAVLRLGEQAGQPTDSEGYVRASFSFVRTQLPKGGVQSFVSVEKDGPVKDLWVLAGPVVGWKETEKENKTDGSHLMPTMCNVPGRDGIVCSKERPDMLDGSEECSSHSTDEESKSSPLVGGAPIADLKRSAMASDQKEMAKQVRNEWNGIFSSSGLTLVNLRTSRSVEITSFSLKGRGGDHVGCQLAQIHSRCLVLWQPTCDDGTRLPPRPFVLESRQVSLRSPRLFPQRNLAVLYRTLGFSVHVAPIEKDSRNVYVSKVADEESGGSLITEALSHASTVARK